MTTHDELKSAIEYAEAGWMHHQCPDGNTDCKVARVLAEAYLAYHDPTPVERLEVTDQVRRVLDNMERIRTAGQLRMLKAVAGA